MNRKINFTIGDKVNIEDIPYKVEGAISFRDLLGSGEWTEYKVREETSGKIKWLSIDHTYEEYALYEESTPYEERVLYRSSYKCVDNGRAKVTRVTGMVDTEVGDEVRFKEYEDETTEYIVSIEEWSDETEYAQGYYLDSDEIEQISMGYYDSSTSYYNNSSRETNYNVYDKGIKEKGKIVLIGLVIGFICLWPLLGQLGNFGIGSSKTAIQNYLSKSSNYTYKTSMTSDLQNKYKANVYVSKKDIEGTTKELLDVFHKEIIDVQDSKEDGSVMLFTKKECCLIYTSEENETLVQVSSRGYVYTSTHRPYGARIHTGSFYRNYYYQTAYERDRTTYKSDTSSYTNYTDTDGKNYGSTNGSYDAYLSSVRQSSTTSRNSSGGGISMGK